MWRWKARSTILNKQHPTSQTFTNSLIHQTIKNIENILIPLVQFRKGKKLIRMRISFIFERDNLD